MLRRLAARKFDEHTAARLAVLIAEIGDADALGEVCLQWMNLERGRVKGERIVRVPIGIWDKGYWGRGLGKEAVRRLMQYAFDDPGVDRFCAMDVKEENTRSGRCGPVADCVSMSHMHGQQLDMFDGGLQATSRIGGLARSE